MISRYGETTVSYTVWNDGRRTWGGRTAWELNVGLERFTLSCTLIRSIQKGFGIGRNPHNWMRNVWWTFQIRAAVLKQLNLFALYPPTPTPVLNISFLLGWLAAFRCVDNVAVMAAWLGVIFRKCCGTKQCWVIAMSCLVFSSNDTVKSKKKNRALVWETRFERGTSRNGSKYANWPPAAFHVFTSIYYKVVQIWPGLICV